MTKAMAAEEVGALLLLHGDGTVDHSRVFPTVEELTGRPPRRFSQWARAYADEFR